MNRVQELDPVALLTDRPDLGLVRGQMGTAVLQLASDVWEVEFDDNEGRTYKLAAIPEAELLLGHPIDDDESADAALVELLALGARALLLKGGHLQGSAAMVDRYSDGRKPADFVHDRLDVEGHGTGCTLASAIAANLCLDMPLLAACKAATDYVHGALRHAVRPGRGRAAVLDHFWRTAS